MCKKMVNACKHSMCVNNKKKTSLCHLSLRAKHACGKCVRCLCVSQPPHCRRCVVLTKIHTACTMRRPEHAVSLAALQANQ